MSATNQFHEPPPALPLLGDTAGLRELFAEEPAATGVGVASETMVEDWLAALDRDLASDVGNDLVSDLASDLGSDLAPEGLAGDAARESASDPGSDPALAIASDAVSDVGGDIGGDIGDDAASHVGDSLASDLAIDVDTHVPGDEELGPAPAAEPATREDDPGSDLDHLDDQGAEAGAGLDGDLGIDVAIDGGIDSGIEAGIDVGSDPTGDAGGDLAPDPGHDDAPSCVPAESQDDGVFTFPRGAGQPAGGTVVTVTGGPGRDTISLADFAFVDARWAEGAITLDLGDGSSFTIRYIDIGTIRFADVTLRVLRPGTDYDDPELAGTQAFVDGARMFMVAVCGPGTVYCRYLAEGDALSVLAVDGTGTATSIAIDQLAGPAFGRVSVHLDGTVGSLASAYDLDDVTVMADAAVGRIAVGGGNGGIRSLVFLGDAGPVTVQAQLQAMVVVGDVTGDVTVHGDVQAFTVFEDLQAGSTLRLEGDVASYSHLGHDYGCGTHGVGGSVGTWAVLGHCSSSLTVQHHLDAFYAVGFTGVLTVARAEGPVSLTDGGFSASPDDPGPRQLVYVGGSHQPVALGVSDSLPDTADGGDGGDGADQVVREGTEVTLSAGCSGELDALQLSYAWVQTAGPAVTLSDPDAAWPTFTAPEAFVDYRLTFLVTVTDPSGVAVRDTVTVAVTAGDEPPAAGAGADRTAVEGELVVLDAGLAAPAGSTFSYSWLQTDGPEVALTGASGPSPTFTAPPGSRHSVLAFAVTVTDAEGHASTRSCRVRVLANDDAPVADAGPDQVVTEGSAVTLSAGASWGLEPEPLAHAWTQVGGERVTLTADGATATFTAPAGASDPDLVFQVTVTDPRGDAATDTVTVHVQPRGDDPVPAASRADAESAAAATADAAEVAAASPGAPEPVVAGDDAPIRLRVVGAITMSGGQQAGLWVEVEDPAAEPRVLWRQVGGQPVALSDARSARPTFYAPSQDENYGVTFAVTVTVGADSRTETVKVDVLRTAPAGAPASPPAMPASPAAAAGDATGAAGGARRSGLAHRCWGALRGLFGASSQR